MSPLHRLIRATRRRERWSDAAMGLSRWALPVGLWIAAVATAATRWGSTSPHWGWLAAVPLPVVLLWAFVRPRSMRATARRIDAHYDLADQLGSAWEFSQHPPATPAPPTTEPDTAAEVVALLLERATAMARELSARPVVPIRLVPPRWTDGLAVVALAAAALLPGARQRPAATWTDGLELPPLAETAGPPIDLTLAEPLRRSLDRLRNEQDAAAALAQQILAILDRLGSGELDRAAALLALAELEHQLAEAEAELDQEIGFDPERLDEALDALADALEEHELTAEAAQALRERRSEDAEQALQEAAEDALEREATDAQLRRAMKEAERRLSRAQDRASSTEDALQEEERRLRKDEQESRADESPQDRERRLQRRRERVEELRRQDEREQAAQRRVEQLRRDAEDAANSRGASARRRSVERLSRNASGASRQSSRASRMQQAREGMEEAKTFVRSSGKEDPASKRRREQFRRFSERAEGKGDEKGKNGKPSILVEGDVGDDPSSVAMLGEGERGPGEDGSMPGEGHDGSPSSEGEGGARGATMPGERGDGAGHGSSDPQGESRSLRTKTHDIHVDAREGRGVSRAQVISDSGQRGFASEPYRRVYSDYRSFAQSAIDNEALPPAKRRTVKHYYQLIQPRD